MQSTGTNSDTAVFGGSFDPIHRGHLHILHEVSLLGSFRRVLIVPALLSNFKQERKPVSFEERVKMVNLAIEDYRDIYPEDTLEIELSLIEGERGGISYTSDTVRALLPKYGTEGRIGFIIGDDIIPTLSKWHDFDYLREHVDFHCFTRGGGKKDACGARVLFHETEVFDASSTDIRNGRTDLLSPRVRRYAEEHGIYEARPVAL